jgi:hypothetical protein
MKSCTLRRAYYDIELTRMQAKTLHYGVALTTVPSRRLQLKLFLRRHFL